MKKIKQIILQVILSFVIITNCNSQNWQWAKHFGSVNGDAAGEMCVDQTGNIYLTGQFALPQGTNDRCRKGRRWRLANSAVRLDPPFRQPTVKITVASDSAALRSVRTR